MQLQHGIIYMLEQLPLNGQCPSFCGVACQQVAHIWPLHFTCDWFLHAGCQGDNDRAVRPARHLLTPSPPAPPVAPASASSYSSPSPSTSPESGSDEFSGSSSSSSGDESPPSPSPRSPPSPTINPNAVTAPPDGTSPSPAQTARAVFAGISFARPLTIDV